MPRRTTISREVSGSELLERVAAYMVAEKLGIGGYMQRRGDALLLLSEAVKQYCTPSEQLLFEELILRPATRVGVLRELYGRAAIRHLLYMLASEGEGDELES